MLLIMTTSSLGTYQRPFRQVDEIRKLELWRLGSQHFAEEEDFQEVIQVDPEQLNAADHDDVKLRNPPASFQTSGRDPEA
jgi:hypothetical protein